MNCACCSLPAICRRLKPGWKRDYLLLVDGWAKDGDYNTAFSQSVEPLPFHAMTSYPYPTSQHFPDDAAHREYQERYNTRPALRLIRPCGWMERKRPMNSRKLLQWTAILFIVLLVNTAYISAFASPTIFYMGNVLLHFVLGVALTVALLFLLRQFPVAAGFFLAASALGLFLAIRGNTLDHRWALVAHIVAAAIGLMVLIPFAMRQAPAFRKAFQVSLALLVAFPLRHGGLSKSSTGQQRAHPECADRSDFHGRRRRRAEVAVLPLVGQNQCRRHHSIELLHGFGAVRRVPQGHLRAVEKLGASLRFVQQPVLPEIDRVHAIGGRTKPSKWCAGCHDHAVFFNGRFDRPIKEQIDTPEARAGLACTSCHSIVHVNSTMGNGDFTIEYPPLHELATSRNRYIHALDYFLTYLNPGPHKKSFLKPFMRGESAEFCAACHKVHLDVPVNKYRWFRGFNDYDNWQASGVSGQGARSFYYPAKSQVCADCHMPLVKSHDPGNHDGKVHSHRFPAANMAVAYVNHDEAQMKATEQFLKSGFITVDIFAVSPVESKGTEMGRRTSDAPQAMSGFAVGEEAESASTGVIREVGQIAAPIDHAGTKLQPGSTARVDVVVRTRKIGHFFPAGTVDAFDVWLELRRQRR